MNWATLFNAPVGDLLWRKRQELRGRTDCKPPIGATICCSGLRMTVQAGLSDELWRWLVGRGWRELERGENRLRLKPLPTTLVTRLFDATVEDRERALNNAIRQVVRPKTNKTPERAVAS